VRATGACLPAAAEELALLAEELRRRLADGGLAVGHGGAGRDAGEALVEELEGAPGRGGAGAGEAIGDVAGIGRRRRAAAALQIRARARRPADARQRLVVPVAADVVRPAAAGRHAAARAGDGGRDGDRGAGLAAAVGPGGQDAEADVGLAGLDRLAGGRGELGRLFSQCPRTRSRVGGDRLGEQRERGSECEEAPHRHAESAIEARPVK
jgi:hypothetical protein